ncbi:SH3 domain-containing protein [Roseibium aquae]|nr:SH3 domain-containing protein [Roseibium aquae]
MAVPFVLLATILPERVDAKSCVISDPTDRALNVRETPNGRVINRLKNGRTVEITQFENDAKGRPWGYATGYYEGRFRNWGWVFMEALACGGPKDISQIAGKSCVVADPVDPTLNVRATPNGELINRLRNGRIIRITEIRDDANGRPWGYAVGNFNGQFRNWGWVFLQHVDCSNAPLDEAVAGGGDPARSATPVTSPVESELKKPSQEQQEDFNAWLGIS